MRGIVSYVLAGVLTAVAIDVALPALGFGSSVGASQDTIQIVDRSNKGDRLMVPAASIKPATPAPTRIMAGCDPAFSPLSAVARGNFAARCTV